MESRGTFAYLIGDSFAKLGLGMIADGTPVFGLTGWAGTFAALDAAAIGCICLMAIVAIFEERKIRREKRTVFCRLPDSRYLVTLPGQCAGLFYFLRNMPGPTVDSRQIPIMIVRPRLDERDA